jgi:hypothetical protein
VTAVLDVWDSWSLYPPHSLLACRTAFSGKDAANTLDGEELDMSMFEQAGEEEEVTATPAIDNGGDAKRQKTSASSDAAAEDVDGEPMDGEDMDGEPMDDSLLLSAAGGDVGGGGANTKPLLGLSNYADAEEAD